MDVYKVNRGFDEVIEHQVKITKAVMRNNAADSSKSKLLVYLEYIK